MNQQRGKKGARGVLAANSWKNKESFSNPDRLERWKKIKRGDLCTFLFSGLI
jgi:hypothetical protein